MAINFRGLRKYYGLEHPFEFRVAVPLLLSLSALILVLAFATFLSAVDELSRGTDRFYFFCYLLALLSLSAAFSRSGAISLAIVIWCFSEASLAFSTRLLEMHGIALSLFPDNWFSQEHDPRFSYHPLLGRVPTPRWRGAWQIDRRNNEAMTRLGWPITSAEYFHSLTFTHNSLGLRGKELSTHDLTKDLIFVDGGSTTYDQNVTQGSTWPEQLEIKLGRSFTIVNFGVPGHSTTQHLIHTAFYQNILIKKPVCAIYYIGWNDLINSHVQDIDRAYSNYLTLSLVYRKPRLWAARYSPLLRFAYHQAKRRFDSVPEPASEAYESLPATGNDSRLEQIYVEHVSTLAAINKSRDVVTVFVGQVINEDFLRHRPDAYDVRLMQPFENRDILVMQERLNTILERTSYLTGTNYVDVGSENFSTSDFVDLVHFSAQGSKKFAELISKSIERRCQ